MAQKLILVYNIYRRKECLTQKGEFGQKVDMQYFAEKWVGGGDCMEACPKGIRIENGKRVGLENCTLCRACEDACMSGAL